MEASDVQNQVEGASYLAQAGYVVLLEINLDACLSGFPSGFADGATDEIHSNDLPAMFGQLDGICACPATQV